MAIDKIERRILAFLLRTGTAEKVRLYNWLYAERHRELPDPKCIDVHVCHLRRKLEPLDVVIETAWGVGYTIPENSRQKLRQLMTPASPPLAAAA